MIVYATTFGFIRRGDHWSSANKTANPIEVFVGVYNFVDIIMCKFIIWIRTTNGRPYIFQKFYTR